VLVDSGFRRGSDIAAALALGARGVLVGRAYLYGLAAAGEAGVRHCIDILAKELRMTMQLCGARSVAELDRGLIRRREPRAAGPPGAGSQASGYGRLPAGLAHDGRP
jgi:isopentenyl diphosphate isomerase/L-lactate dehydrogenase-like FMN-dependent dehydrogenase